jgi:outer membrane protein insertion porin family
LRSFRGVRSFMSFLCLWLFSQAIEGAGSPVIVSGPQGLSDKSITRQIIRLAERSRPDSLRVRIEAMLDEAGYLDHRLRMIGDTLEIETGPAYTIGQTQITVVRADGNIERQQTNQYQGAAAGRLAIERIKNGLLDGDRQRGNYFASLTAQAASVHDHRLDLDFKVITGPLVRVQRVRFKGLTRTDPAFVEKLSGVKTGQPFVDDDIDRAVGIIESTGFLAIDTLPYILPNEEYDAVEVVVPLRDLKANTVELGGGYLPRQGGKPGELVGKFDFHSLNLFGTGRKLQALLERKDRASSRIVFSFSQPLFIPEYLEASVHLEQTDYDSSYQSFAAEGTLGMISGGNTRASAGIGWTKTEPQRSSQSSSRTLSGLMRLHQQSLDFPPNPSRGYAIGIGAAYLRRSSRPDTSATDIVNNETTFDLAGETYLRMYRGWIWRLNLQTRMRLTSRDLIDHSEMFKLGGYGSLRGYRQDQFAGRRTVLAQAELRRRLSPDLALYLFADWGYVYDKKESRPGVVSAYDLNRWGKGGGGYVGGESARLTMEFGWGQGDRLGEGKLHLGLTTVF